MQTIAELRNMSDSPVKTTNGLYPATHGFKVELGEYGEWKGGQWCRLGNIFTDFGKIYFNTKSENCNRVEVYNRGVTLKSGVESKIAADNAKIGLELQFNSTGAIYFMAHIVKENRFMAIKNEVYSFLEEHIAKGDWNYRYWLAVEVWFSDNLLSMQSASKSGKAVIIGQTGDVPTLPEAKLKLDVEYDKAEISLLQFNDEKKQFAGAKFVGFTKEGIFQKRLLPEYKGENFDYEIASEQVIYA